mgnify:CR=1 FL=1
MYLSFYLSLSSLIKLSLMHAFVAASLRFGLVSLISPLSRDLWTSRTPTHTHPNNMEYTLLENLTFVPVSNPRLAPDG